jgi:hypothetical protein
MYLPYLSRRPPTKGECRAAGIESVIGAVFWVPVIAYTPPRNLWLGILLILIGLALAIHGVSTLNRGAYQFGAWPRFLLQPPIATNNLPAQLEVSLRYRSLAMSYAILCGLLVTIALWTAITGAFEVKSSHLSTQHSLQLAWLIPLLLAPVLPQAIAPWLDEHTEANISGTTPSKPPHGLWVRVAPWLAWILLALAVWWLFQQMPTRNP